MWWCCAFKIHAQILIFAAAAGVAMYKKIGSHSLLTPILAENGAFF